MFVRRSIGLLGLSLGLLIGCTSLHPSTQLPEEERGLYRAYSRIMTSSQLHAYLALPTATERTAYAQRIGAWQRLEALSADDRAAVLHGQPFVGLSKQALYLLWGEPYLQEGLATDERWWYLGDYFSLTDVGNQYHSMDTVMEVALENGYVKWWQERVPSEKPHLPFHRRFLYRPGD